MAFLLIRDTRYRSFEILKFDPEKTPSHKLVERWQRESIRYKATGRLPEVEWKMAESDNVVGAMMEGASMRRSVPEEN